MGPYGATSKRATRAPYVSTNPLSAQSGFALRAIHMTIFIYVRTKVPDGHSSRDRIMNVTAKIHQNPYFQPTAPEGDY